MKFTAVFYPAIGGLGLIIGFAVMGRLTWSLCFVALIASLTASIALNAVLRRRR